MSFQVVTARACTWSVAAVLAASLVAIPGTASASTAQPLAEPAPAATESPDVLAGRIAVTWEPGTSAADRSAIRSRHGLEGEESYDAIGVEVVSVPDHAVERVTEALRRQPGVASAEPDFVMARTTNDPGYRDLWGLENTGQAGGAVGVDIDAREAWATTTGDPRLIVAVIDTGVDISHPDLAGNVWRNPGEIPGNGIDDDRNGYVDDVHGWDFHNGDATVFDSATEDAHGTHVAGTIAALGDNGRGVVGVSPDVTIMPIKFLGGADGSGSGSAAAAAVAYAYANGATIINTSWGGGGGTALRNAINAATGAIVVAGAGNLGDDMDATTPQFPAAWASDSYGMPNVLSVASIDRTGAMSSFSNYGARSVDIGAPGRDIVSTYPGDRYAWNSGTSMSAPHASGVATLVASVGGVRTGAQLADAVKAGVRPIASLAGKTTTGGLLDADGALATVAAPTTSTEPLTDPDPGTTVPEPTDAEPTDPGVTDPDPATGPAPYDGIGARSLDWACPDITRSGFLDVLPGTTHAPGVGCAHLWGVFSGSADGLFDPKADLSRGQLASVLVRGIEAAIGEALPAGADHFDDDDTSVHAASIDKLAELGIVGGLSETRYGPSASVTRGQFASMLARTYRYLAGDLPAGGGTFTDDDGSVHEPSIDALAGLGIVAGTGDGRYQPGASLSRDQSATLVARLLDALVEAGVADGR